MKKILIAFIMLSSGLIVATSAHAQLLPASALNLGSIEAKKTTTAITPAAINATAVALPDIGIEPSVTTNTTVVSGAVTNINPTPISSTFPVTPSVTTTSTAHGNNYGVVLSASNIPTLTNITPVINLNQPTEPAVTPATTGSTGGSTGGGIVSVGSYNTYHPAVTTPVVLQPVVTHYQSAVSQVSTSKTATQVKAVEVVKEQIPLLQIEDDTTISKSTGNNYAASTRGVGIGISLFGILLAIAAILGIAVMFREYQERKRVTQVVYQ